MIPVIPPTGLPGAAGTTGIGSQASGVVSGTIGAITSTKDFLALLGKGSTWIRVLLVLGGIGLMLFGLITAVKDTRFGKEAIGAATKAVVAA